jgi:hypothetical protein
MKAFLVVLILFHCMLFVIGINLINSGDTYIGCLLLVLNGIAIPISFNKLIKEI